MSLVGNGIHDVLIYNGKQKALTEQRLVVVQFKTPSEKKDDPDYKRPDARCVSVPQISCSVTPAILQDAMQQALEDMQDSVIRKLVVAAIEEGKNVITIMDAQINYGAICEWAKEQAAGGKLNKELLEDWFDENLGDKLTVALAGAMKIPADQAPTSEQEKKIADAVTGYKTVFKMFSAPKAGISPKVAAQLKRTLELVENKEDRVYKALMLKVQTHLEQQDPQLMGL